MCRAEDYFRCRCWEAQQAPVVSGTINPALLSLNGAATHEQAHYWPAPTQPAPAQPNNEFGFFPELDGALPDNQVVMPPFVPLDVAAQPVPVAQPPVGDNKPQAPPINLSQQLLLRGRGRPKKAEGAPKQPYKRKTGPQAPKHARPGRPKGSKDQAQRRPKGEGKKALREKALAAHRAETEAAAAPEMAAPTLPTQEPLPAPGVNWDPSLPSNGLQEPLGWGWPLPPTPNSRERWGGTAPMTEEEIGRMSGADFDRLFPVEYPSY